jgi:hypothetical protein
VSLFRERLPQRGIAQAAQLPDVIHDGIGGRTFGALRPAQKPNEACGWRGMTTPPQGRQILPRNGHLKMPRRRLLRRAPALRSH